MLLSQTNRVRVVIAKFYYFSLSIIIFLKGRIYGSRFNQDNANEIPIIINNRNRLTYLLQLINFLENNNCLNIIIIDNNSTYPPLIEYYSKCPYQVVHLQQNIGYLALERSELWRFIKKDYFVYTDPDVVPINECPNDFMRKFFNILQDHRFFTKIGFSLKIDDLPECYSEKNKVVAWESQFYKNKLDDKLYIGKVDTTFALHRPWSKISYKGRYKHLRSEFPYQARHLPWYEDSLNPTEENNFYKSHAEIGGFWTIGYENRSLASVIFSFNNTKHKVGNHSL